MAKVNPWGNKDNADGVPIFAPAYVNQATTDENASALYTTKWTFCSNQHNSFSQ